MADKAWRVKFASTPGNVIDTMDITIGMRPSETYPGEVLYTCYSVNLSDGECRTVVSIGYSFWEVLTRAATAFLMERF